MDRYLLLKGLAFFAILFSLAACDGPSTVGAELLEGDSGLPDPAVLPLSATQDTVASETGDARQILTGAVDDPLLGNIAATGYLDFRAGQSVDSTFRSKRLRLVFLDLFLTGYAYGDTTSTVTLRLHDMPAEWEVDGATADTSLIAERTPIKSFTFTTDDSLVTVQLPPDWVAAHERELKSENVEDLFHGFQLAPASESAVVGFDGSRTRLRAIAGVDTALYGVSKSLTTIRRTGVEAVPPNRLVIQDGTGLTVRLTIADSAEVPTGVAVLNHAELRLDFDAATLSSSPDFFRPKLQRIRLYGIPVADTSARAALFDFRRTDAGAYVAVSIGRAPPPEEIIRRILQRRLREGPIYERFVLAPIPRAAGGGPIPGATQLINSLNVALLYGEGAPRTCGADDSNPCAPQITFVYTPVE